MSIGKSPPRLDGYDKVTGRARYTEDCCRDGTLVARVLHATIARGRVLEFDLDQALQVPGVIKIVTCFDVPDLPFDTGTHPWSTEPERQGIEDRRLLNANVRYYGDDIAAVIATDELAAKQALRKIKVYYEEQPPVLDVFSAMQPGAPVVNDLFPDNILAHTSFCAGKYEQITAESGLRRIEGWYETPQVKHCQLEPAGSFAYQENGRLVVYSSTQTPHSLRRVIGQALGISWGKVRVIKPCVGGGFGNKEDALYEPLNAFLTTQVGGRCVQLILTREEDLVNTRVRHGLVFHMVSYVRGDGSIAARCMTAYANKGAYCHHGHAIVSKAASAFRMMYCADAVKADMYTVLTNTPCAGAMRGYGAPQAVFAVEAHADDIAVAIGMDPLAFRQKNLMKVGAAEPEEYLVNYFDSLRQCLAKGAEQIGYAEKIVQYQNQTGPRRRGIGVAACWYNTGAYPYLLEACTCRMSLNQDGSVQVQMPEVEIGQGADTVFAHMTAQVLQLPMEMVHMVSWQDTDTVPSGSGAYASRQTYTGGAAIAEVGVQLRQKILAHAAQMYGVPEEKLELCQAQIRWADTGKQLCSLADVAMHAQYQMEHPEILRAEQTVDRKTNALSLGCCFAEVEVDLSTGVVKVQQILNVHDCGTVIHPQMAAAQVHGGISMGIGYALSEQLLLDEKTGRVRNPNLLDYKLPTSMDHPAHLGAYFVENPEPTSPFGTKALGEPPAVPVAPAIHNAVRQATGISMRKLPMDAQSCCLRFREEGLI